MASVDDFCNSCKALPWRKVFERPDGGFGGKFRVSPVSDTCWLCMLMQQIALKRNKHVRIFMVAFSFHGIVEITSRSGYPTYACFKMELPDSYVSTEGLLQGDTRPIDTQQINWDDIRTWIDVCSADPQHLGCRPADIALDNFRLIDCLSRTVILAPPGARYAALSYVWGSSAVQNAPLDGNALPDTVPLCIEDAMHCARQLGHCYLWVDRYCIDQESSSKHQQIQNMDRIYGCASVTIINAAGKDSESGLPGVSTVARYLEEDYFDIDDKRLSRIPLSGRTIRDSKWASRGWTLQEGLLSNRRLVFTPAEVYFQCRECYCYESVPKAFNPIKARYRGDDYEAFTHFEQSDTEAWNFTFDKLLDEYLSRSLTYDSDILIAFLAVFRVLNVDHFWGIPFRFNEEHSLDAKLIGRLLQPVEAERNSQSVLRDRLPTWSWAAWKNSRRSWPRLSMSNVLETSVAVEMTTGQRYSLAEYCSSLRKDGNLDSFLPLLHIRGWMTTMQFDRNDRGLSLHDQGLSLHDILDREGRCSQQRAIIFDVVLPKEPEWSKSQLFVGSWPVLIFIERDEGQRYEYNVSGLILKPFKDGTYQRLGIIMKEDMIVEWKSSQSLQIREIPERGDGEGSYMCERCSITLS